MENVHLAVQGSPVDPSNIPVGARAHGPPGPVRDERATRGLQGVVRRGMDVPGAVEAQVEPPATAEQRQSDELVPLDLRHEVRWAQPGGVDRVSRGRAVPRECADLRRV